MKRMSERMGSNLGAILIYPQQRGSFLECFLELCERLIVLAKASVDYGELVTRYAFFL